MLLKDRPSPCTIKREDGCGNFLLSLKKRRVICFRFQGVRVVCSYSSMKISRRLVNMNMQGTMFVKHEN